MTDYTKSDAIAAAAKAMSEAGAFPSEDEMEAQLASYVIPGASMEDIFTALSREIANRYSAKFEAKGLEWMTENVDDHALTHLATACLEDVILPINEAWVQSVVASDADIFHAAQAAKGDAVWDPETGGQVVAQFIVDVLFQATLHTCKLLHLASTTEDDAEFDAKAEAVPQIDANYSLLAVISDA